MHLTIFCQIFLSQHAGSRHYWISNYSKLLKKGEQYDDLTPIISINFLNFNLNKKNSNVHSCYMIYDTKTERLLTDHLQIHMIELKKFKKGFKLLTWIFTTKIWRLICQG